MNSSSLLDEYKLPDEPLLGGEPYFGLPQTNASNTSSNATANTSNKPLSPPRSSNNNNIASFSSNMFDDVLQDASPSSKTNTYAPPTVNWAKTHIPSATSQPIPQQSQLAPEQLSEQQLQLQQLQLQQQLRQLELQQQRLQQMQHQMIQMQTPAAHPPLAQQAPPPQYFLPNYSNDLAYSHVPPPNNAFPPSVPASLDTIPTSFQAPPPVVPARGVHYAPQSYTTPQNVPFSSGESRAPNERNPTTDPELQVVYFLNAVDNKNIPELRKCLEQNPFMIQSEIMSGRTAYHLVCERGSLEAINLIRDLMGGQRAIDELLTNMPRPSDWKPTVLNNALLAEAEEGNIDAINRLQELGAELDAKDKYGRSILHVACAKGHAHIVKNLIKLSGKRSGANSLLMDADINTLGEVLQEERHSAISNKLKKTIDLNAQDEDGATPLYEAASAGHENIASMLLAEPTVAVNVGDKDGATPLYLAAQNNHEGLVKMLLARPDIDPNHPLKNGATPLHIAVYNAHTEVIDAILSHPKVDVNFANYNGATILVLACYCGHEQVVQRLLEVPSVDVNKSVPLYIATEKGHVGIISRLLSVPTINVNATNSEGWTPLCIAAQNGHEDAVRLLLAQPNVDYQKAIRNTGTTPLLIAARNGHPKIVRMLLEKDESQLNQPNSSGWTPLLISVDKGNEGVVRELLTWNNIDVNKALPPQALTPLHIAAQKGLAGIAFLLLSEGADVSAKTIVVSTSTSTSATASTTSSTPQKTETHATTTPTTLSNTGSTPAATSTTSASTTTTTTTTTATSTAQPATATAATKSVVQKGLAGLANLRKQYAPAMTQAAPSQMGDTPMQLALKNNHQAVATMIETFENKVPHLLLQRMIQIQRQIEKNARDHSRTILEAPSSNPTVFDVQAPQSRERTQVGGVDVEWKERLETSVKNTEDTLQTVQAQLEALRQENTALKTGLQKIMTALQTGFNTVYATILEQKQQQQQEEE